jgi:uncharacterized membrane-anchored protein
VLGLAKLGKLIVVAVAAVGAFFKKLFQRIFGKRQTIDEVKPPEA